MIVIFVFFNFAHRAQCNSSNFYFGLPAKCSLSFRTAKKKGCLFHCWKGQPLALMVSLLLLRLGLCILGHPSHAGHRVRSSARLTLSISLFGPVRPCVPLKNNLFHRTYLCRSLFAEAEGRSFFAERCRHPGGESLRRAPRVRRVFL